MSALEFDAVTHAYGPRVAMKSFTLAVEDGEILGLLGPSGSGKTTALRVAAGLESPQKGKVYVGGKLVSEPGVDIPPEQRDVGLLFQDLALFPHLTVASNVAFGLHGARSAQRRMRTNELLELVGLSDYAQSYPHQLSGGQQQRVALARALAPKPKVLLLDEPFSNLDVVLRQQVRREMLNLLKTIGTSALFVTHDPEEALFMADRVAVMRDGTIMQTATPEAIYLKPANRFVASFFGETNVIPAAIRAGCAETPFGAIPVNGLLDGTAADVLVRAQGLLVSKNSNGAHATVRSARILGATVLLELQPAPPTGLKSNLIARVAMGTQLQSGDTVTITLDPRFAFAFARD